MRYLKLVFQKWNADNPVLFWAKTFPLCAWQKKKKPSGAETSDFAINNSSFFYNLFTKRTDKQYRYEIPREEPREAHGYLALDFIAMVALSVYVTL
jgi:hypothetical protein